MGQQTNGPHVVWFDDGKRPNVADVLEQSDDVAMHRLDFAGEARANWAVMESAHVYCITSTRDEVPDEYKADEQLIERCPNLLVVSTSGAGYDPVNVAACTAAGILVVNQAGANAEAVAEHAVGMMLGLSKKMLATDRALRTTRGQPRETFKGWNAEGKTVGLVGLGNTGRRVARICGLGLNMRVLASDPYLSDDVVIERGAEPRSLDELLATSDYVSVHCPYNAETRDLLDADALARMKPTAFLVNCARGGIVNEDALAYALANELIAGAGIDVWVVEPPPLDHPLLGFDNVIATYHTAGITYDSRANMATWNAEQVLATLAGERPPRLINPDAWPAFERRFNAVLGRAPDRFEG